MKNIEEFSVSFREDTRDFSLKYKLVMIMLMCLIEMSNQYFYFSARSCIVNRWLEFLKVIFLLSGNMPSVIKSQNTEEIF